MNEKTVLITGGTKGLGKKIAEIFLKNNYKIVLAARNIYDCNFPKENFKFIHTDVTKILEIEKAVKETIEWTGSLDVLINNAGYSEWKELSNIDELFWDNMISTNLKSVLFASKFAFEAMKSNSSIINISSLAGKRGSSNNSVYCATKFGVNGLTQALAKELGVKGIRVNAVCPVYLRTEGLESALSETQSPSKGQNINDFLSDFTKTQTALGVLPTEEQVANTCLFLASDLAGAITGQCINVDCGVMPQ
jgi:NAD(P)-dependent dehydrogenase (short-subunit alcohol dehydrogenase family)